MTEKKLKEHFEEFKKGLLGFSENREVMTVDNVSVYSRYCYELQQIMAEYFIEFVMNPKSDLIKNLVSDLKEMIALYEKKYSG